MRIAPVAFAFGAAGPPDVELRVADYAPGRRQPRHAHEFTTITLHLAGGIREWARGGDVVSRGLQVSVKPAGVPHADLYGGAGARTFQVILSPDFRPGWKRGDHAVREWRWVAGPCVRAALRLLRTARRHPAEVDALREDVIGLVEAVGDATSVPSDAARPSWLVRALECLHDRAGQPVRVREAAVAAGVHPVHLARVFRRHLGCSVSGYARRLRLERAATLLSLERATISEVAHSCGFADQSHLTRALRRETGLTPATFRRLADRPDVASVQDAGALRG